MNFLKKYYDISQPSSYTGLNSFFRKIKNKKNKFNRKNLKNWLQQQETYNLHYPVRKKFERNSINVGFIDQLWQIDLCDVRNISEFNDGFNYILTAIDVFSKYAWAIPIKSKDSINIIKSFDIIFASNRKPNSIQADKVFLNNKNYFQF